MKARLTKVVDPIANGGAVVVDGDVAAAAAAAVAAAKAAAAKAAKAAAAKAVAAAVAKAAVATATSRSRDQPKMPYWRSPIHQGRQWLASQGRSTATCPTTIPNGDTFVPGALIRQHRLQEGSEVVGQAGFPSPRPATPDDGGGPEGRRHGAGGAASELPQFRSLTVIDPEPMFVLAPGSDENVSLRIVDLLCPIGYGTRGLVVAPPRSGKTVLMQQICASISEHHPDVHIIVLLIDERPEEATGWKRSVTGQEPRSAGLDARRRSPRTTSMVSEICLKRAQRLVETGRDVVILLDSITRLTRAYNSALGGRGGGTMSGGLGSKVLEIPKKFFGAARNCEDGGSLTILGTTLVDTGSRMDQVIFEEFKGTGNQELVLNRQLAERRVYPAIDVELSGTRKEELLLGAEVTQRLYTLRRVLGAHERARCDAAVD